MLSLPKNDEADSHLTDASALRPLKLPRQTLELNFKFKALDCEIELPLGLADVVDPKDRAVVDVAAISHPS